MYLNLNIVVYDHGDVVNINYCYYNYWHQFVLVAILNHHLANKSMTYSYSYKYILYWLLVSLPWRPLFSFILGKSLVK